MNPLNQFELRKLRKALFLRRFRKKTKSCPNCKRYFEELNQDSCPNCGGDLRK